MSADTSPFAVLCVDDEPGMAELIGTHLERADGQLSATAATSAEEGIELLETREFDCIVSDYDMPRKDGLVFLELIRAERPDLPFILFTGRGSEEIASEAISAGVTDYMQKESGTEQYQVLARRVRNAVSRHRLRQEAGAAKEYAETILEASPNAILVSIDGECAYANPAAVDLFAAPDKSTLLREGLSSLLRHENRPESEVFSGVRSDEELIERDRLSAITETREVPVEGTARRITWDESPAVVYILRDISERVEYEREVEYRQSLLNTIFEASPDGILIADDDWEILEYNEQFAELWDVPEELLESGDGRLAIEAILDSIADPETFTANIERQFDNPEETQHNRVRLTDGTVFDQYSAPVLTGDGAHHGYVWFYRDITELTGLQRTQQEAFDRMTDAVYALDEDWEFTFLNERAEQLLQRDGDDLLGANVWAEFPEAADGEIAERFHQARDSGKPVIFELYYETLDTEFEIRAYPSKTGLTVYFRDITEQRRTEAELEATVEALHSLYETASDFDTSFEVKQDRLLDIGCEYLDLPYGFVTEISEETQTIVASTGSHELLQPGESCPIEESYCRKTVSTKRGLLAVDNAGVEGWTGDAAYELFELGAYIGGRIIVDGELYGTVCFAASEPRGRAFSEMERTFVELLTRWLSYELDHRKQQSELESTNAQLEEFASIVSHDLRNPLSVADGYLDLAIEEHDSDDLRQVEDALERMRELIEDVLMLAREGEVIGELTHVDLGSVGERCWENVETKTATLDVETDAVVVADESRLTQLIENLLRNAMEHGGDDVTISIGELPDGFYVEDDGPGFPEERATKLFESGYSTKAEGTGLGLRIVKQIATAHGWDIEATTGADGGARFEITGVERP